MTEVRRYGGRTYGRNNQEPSPSSSAASRAFDDAVKPKPTNLKWGNASYVKPRNGDGPDLKKPKLEVEETESDPFSFEFDSDRSPRKKASKAPATSNRTVVLQPAVRITSSHTKTQVKPLKTELDDAEGEEVDLSVRKGAVEVRTYSKRAGRKIKEEHDLNSSVKDEYSEMEVKPAQDPFDLILDSTQGTSGSAITVSDSQEISDDLDDDLYIEKDDGDTTDVKDDSFLLQDDKEDIFTRKKRDPTQQMMNTDGEEITVRFRSHYLNPEVYSKFTENVKPKDPVGSLSNSKVVHKDVLKHDSGTTLIVVCSPKMAGQEIKQSNTQSKYFKDNLKDIAKSKKNTGEQIAKRSRGRRAAQPPPEKDPYELDDDPPEAAAAKPQAADEPESPIVISSGTEDTQPSSQEEPSLRRSSRNVQNQEPEEEPKKVTVETIVKSVKAAPPRKYHKIFRSRNKGYMEPQPEPEESTEPESQTTEESSVGDSQMEAVPEEATAAAVAEAPSEVEETQETVTPETSQSTEDQSQEPMELSQAESATESLTDSQEVEASSSQQSAVSDSQSNDELPSSQEFLEPAEPKKRKSIKTPPAERKIFRARGAQSSAQKKIFSSPKKAAAVYNVRSWQDEEEMPPPLARPAAAQQPGGTSSKMGPPGGDAMPKLKPVIKKPSSSSSSKPGKDQPNEMPRLTRAVHWQSRGGDDAYTSVHVNKEHKELFTVVKNVKEAHECQEFGETQEFDDDIVYLLAGIESIEPMSTRCLSCVGLAQKCIIPAFRMHLRAHGTVTKIFGCLQDAAADPSLALCTSALMFMLSRDRLNMDLERESLDLMLRLLGVDQQEDMAPTLSPTATRALNRNKDRVLEVYKEFLKGSGGKSDSIDEECLSTGNLAMESLLSLTSRRAGEWFKEELRSLGALDHIVDTVCSCVEAIGEDVNVLTNSNVENLKKTDRCLRVLESVTYLNADNQNYLINYKDSCLVASLKRALVMCQQCLVIYPLYENLKTEKVDKESFGWVVYSCILAVLRVLLNLTHDNDTGCVKIGEQDTTVETVLLCILQTPQYVPTDLRFDLFVLSLGLMINLVEHSELNRNKLMSMETKPTFENKSQDTQLFAYNALVEVFINREESAKQLEEADEPQTPEASPNKSGEWRESDSGMEWVIDSAKKKTPVKKSNGKMDGDNGKDLDDEETFTKALHKAGKHMENSIVAAYVALLVGCLIQNNEQCAVDVKDRLPDKNFTGMIYMLKKFLGFMNLTSGSGSAGSKSIERVIEVLEKC